MQSEPVESTTVEPITQMTTVEPTTVEPTTQMTTVEPTTVTSTTSAMVEEETINASNTNYVGNDAIDLLVGGGTLAVVGGTLAHKIKKNKEKNGDHKQE